jgi:hypothetical protein
MGLIALLSFPLHQRSAVTQWQVDRGARVFSQPFGRAGCAALRGNGLMGSPAHTGHVRQVEHGSSIKCGLKAPRSPGSVADCHLRRQVITILVGTLVPPKGKSRIAPLEQRLHDQPRPASALTTFGPEPCFARTACCKSVPQSGYRAHSARLTMRCSGRGPINCSARGRPVSRGRV